MADALTNVVRNKAVLMTELITSGVPVPTAVKIINDAYWQGWQRGYNVARMEPDDPE